MSQKRPSFPGAWMHLRAVLTSVRSSYSTSSSRPTTCFSTAASFALSPAASAFSSRSTVGSRSDSRSRSNAGAMLMWKLVCHSGMKRVSRSQSSSSPNLMHAAAYLNWSRYTTIINSSSAPSSPPGPPPAGAAAPPPPLPPPVTSLPVTRAPGTAAPPRAPPPGTPASECSMADGGSRAEVPSLKLSVTRCVSRNFVILVMVAALPRCEDTTASMSRPIERNSISTMSRASATSTASPTRKPSTDSTRGVILVSTLTWYFHSASVGAGNRSVAMSLLILMTVPTSPRVLSMGCTQPHVARHTSFTVPSSVLTRTRSPTSIVSSSGAGAAAPAGPPAPPLPLPATDATAGGS
mmetsp:Transcript_27737/g.95987  ORF Transcript_27737/g.95987 Transcript_27737/m.95987 type:complete len:351 (-) Transcript_27737:340-1392(-)